MKFNRFITLLGWILVLFSLPARGEHGPLLPRPQQVAYAAGGFPLKNGLAVRFAMPPNPQDRFTARQLADRLAIIIESPVKVGEGKATGISIVLKRTGE